MFGLKKTDSALLLDVTNELKWDPSVTEANLTVTAKEGMITLRGNVPHYSEKHTAELAAQRVRGVRAVANEIEVEMMGSFERNDEDIARTALTILDWNYQIPKNISLSIDHGWITLKGEVEWEYQRFAAKNAMSLLMGVRGVTNDIKLRSKIKTHDVQTRIEEALLRTAEKEGSEIRVTVLGGEVTLTGNVHSFKEMEDARYAAWNAKGVTSVKDNLTFAAA